MVASKEYLPVVGTVNIPVVGLKAGVVKYGEATLQLVIE